MTKRPMVVAHVHVKAEQIRKIVSESGEIFGEPVDMTDIDEVIYAAYFAGWAEGVIDSAKLAPPLDGRWKQCPACGAVETPDYIIRGAGETVGNLKSQLVEALAEIVRLRKKDEQRRTATVKIVQWARNAVCAAEVGPVISREMIDEARRAYVDLRKQMKDNEAIYDTTCRLLLEAWALTRDDAAPSAELRAMIETLKGENQP